MLEELEAGELEFETVEKKESVKVAELRKLEQGGKTIEEFVQKFKRAARGSGYEGRLLGERRNRQKQCQILSQPLVWQRRQTPSQQATTGSAPMERVERSNAVMVRGQG